MPVALLLACLISPASAQERDLSLIVGLPETSVGLGDRISVGYVVGNPTPNPAASWRIEWFGSTDAVFDGTDIKLGATRSEREIIANSFQEDSVALDSCLLGPGTWRIIGRLTDVVPGDDNPENDIAVAAEPLQIRAADTPSPCANDDPTPTLINPGLNDAWFDRGTPGQGLFLAVFPERRVLTAAWFTFDVEPAPEGATATFGAPGQRWVTALGSWTGNQATLDVINTTGGEFNQPVPAVVVDDSYGTIELDVLDCGTIDLRYELPAAGRTGTLTLTRVAQDNVVLCEALSVSDDGSEPGR